ncbi:hypothetical protein V7161_09200 [Neobacillus drentensis]|uniref:hypothetical protein n=1 Tax=Neobacillus drentensis TaxID=220684 RepID=UPI002FFD9C11
MQTGWINFYGYDYYYGYYSFYRYYNSNGAEQHGWTMINGKSYYFDSDGFESISILK